MWLFSTVTERKKRQKMKMFQEALHSQELLFQSAGLTSNREREIDWMDDWWVVTSWLARGRGEVEMNGFMNFLTGLDWITLIERSIDRPIH